MAREKTETMTMAAREPSPSAPNSGTEVGASEARARPGRRSVEDRQQAVLELFDGEVQESEERLFGMLADAFAIPTDEASQILTKVRDELYGEYPEPDTNPGV